MITNVTASVTRRVDMIFGISYSDSIGHAVKLLEELVAAHPLALDTPEPVICVGELADSSVNLICRPWSKTEDYWALYWDLQHLVKEVFAPKVSRSLSRNVACIWKWLTPILKHKELHQLWTRSECLRLLIACRVRHIVSCIVHIDSRQTPASFHRHP